MPPDARALRNSSAVPLPELFRWPPGRSDQGFAATTRDERIERPALLRIGEHCIDTAVVLAPMVGVTDHPFRMLCRRLGTRLAIAEMVSADSSLWLRRKSRLRLAADDEGGAPRWVQIVGNDPALMADAARRQVDLGADIIDINMGCPAKNVCRKAAGSALLRDEPLVEQILDAVVRAVPVPVTLKMRTGWSPAHRNGVRIARIAEDCGIQLLSVHGRTRQCRFDGDAEYDTVRDIVAGVSIPVIANGDITDAPKAAEVLAQTGAAAVMIGRAAQGRPWLCGSVDEQIRNARTVSDPPPALMRRLMLEHLDALHSFYGDQNGTRIARKHIGWYLKGHPGQAEFLRTFYRLETGREQIAALGRYFQIMAEQEVKAA